MTTLLPGVEACAPLPEGAAFGPRDGAEMSVGVGPRDAQIHALGLVTPIRPQGREWVGVCSRSHIDCCDYEADVFPWVSSCQVA